MFGNNFIFLTCFNMLINMILTLSSAYRPLKLEFLKYYTKWRAYRLKKQKELEDRLRAEYEAKKEKDLQAF